jgi:hypothetical protein
MALLLLSYSHLHKSSIFQSKCYLPRRLTLYSDSRPEIQLSFKWLNKRVAYHFLTIYEVWQHQSSFKHTRF